MLEARARNEALRAKLAKMGVRGGYGEAELATATFAENEAFDYDWATV